MEGRQQFNGRSREAKWFVGTGLIPAKAVLVSDDCGRASHGDVNRLDIQMKVTESMTESGADVGLHGLVDTQTNMP